MLLVAVVALPVVFALTLLAPRPSVGGMAVTLLGIYWIGFALAHAVLLRELPHGEGIVIDVLVGTFLGDTGAYLGGRLFGRRPLAPRISPNKTVEGLLSGMAFAIVGVWLAGRYQDWLPGSHALVLGLGVALVGADRRPVRVVRQARSPRQGLRQPVRRPRRRAGSPGRSAVYGCGRVLHLVRVRALSPDGARIGSGGVGLLALGLLSFGDHFVRVLRIAEGQ